MQKNRRHHSAFLKVITTFRLNQKISQKDLAKKLGVSQSFISKYESGERRLDLLELRQICFELNVSLIEFIKEFEKEIDSQQP